MQMLLNTNPGFKPRFKEYLFFEDYSNDEMLIIFEKMADTKGYEVESAAKPVLTRRFTRERALDSFGNARTARSVLDESIERHAYNFIKGKLTPGQRHTITAQDVSDIPRSIDR
jgi:hypothetical protein